ncbi:MAG: phenylacetate--CoA ligase family protein [Gemmatimonadota bacterium]
MSRAARLTGWILREARTTFGAARLPGDALRALVRLRLGQALGAAAESPFHAARLREAGVLRGAERPWQDPERALQDLAPLTKRGLQVAGSQALAGGRVDPAWWSSRSSGSTGEPFRVYYDARGWALLKHLVKLRARRACGLRASDRVALLDAVEPHLEGATALERTGRVRRISVLQPPDSIAHRLDSFRPDAVYALPSALREAVRAGAAAAWRPRLVFTSGELLQGSARAELEAALGCPVRDVYGSSETKEIAWECSRGRTHVNADVVHVEILDGAGRCLPCGEEGDIVATVLVNGAMPLLRYRLGDRGALLDERCPCGLALPLLGVVTGREVDRLQLANGSSVSPYALTCALEDVDGLYRYQVVQLAPDRLRVHAQTAAAGEVTERRIRSALRRATGLPLQVEVEFVDAFGTGPGGKFRVVQPPDPSGR